MKDPNRWLWGKATHWANETRMSRGIALTTRSGSNAWGRMLGVRWQAWSHNVTTRNKKKKAQPHLKIRDYTSIAFKWHPGHANSKLTRLKSSILLKTTLDSLIFWRLPSLLLGNLSLSRPWSHPCLLLLIALIRSPICSLTSSLLGLDVTNNPAFTSVGFMLLSIIGSSISWRPDSRNANLSVRSA